MKVVVRRARNRNEIDTALRLVHDNYITAGYIPLDRVPSITFVGVLDGVIVATVSLFVDDLPLFSIYGGFLPPSARVGEAGMLAGKGAPVLEMMKLLFWTARDMGLTDLIIAVHPKHKDFYTRFLGFEGFGSEVSCPSVCGAPAVLLRLNLAIKATDLKSKHIRSLFFGE